MKIKIPFMKRELSINSNETKTTGTWSNLSGILFGEHTISHEQALRLSAVYACVSVYARTISCLPLLVYKKDSNNNQVEDDQYYLYSLLHDQPNPNMTSSVFIQTMVANQKTYGNAFAWIEYGDDWRAKALWPIQANKVNILEDSNTGKLTYQAIFNNKSMLLQEWEIIHIPCLSLTGIKGRSPIQQTADSMDLSRDIQNFGRAFFKNGARPSGVLEHPDSLSEQAQKRLSNKFNESYSGAKNTAKTMILEEGMKYKQISIAPEEAQFIESKKYSVTEIARIFLVPPPMIGDLEHATFSNIEAQNRNFATLSIMPEVVLWEQELKRKLLNDVDKEKYSIHFDMNGLLRADSETRHKNYATAKQNGYMNTNDIRKKENMNSIGADGDQYYVPLNMIPVQQATDYWKSKISNNSSKMEGGDNDGTKKPKNKTS